MTMSRSDKEQLAGSYADGMATAAHAFLVSFQGISVPQVTQLRNKVRESGGEYAVVKNRIALRAIEGKPIAEVKEHFIGPTAVAYSNDDPVALAKALTDFAKEFPVIEFKAGIVDGQTVGGGEIQAIASLPSREELLGKLLFLMKSPITRLVQGLGGVNSKFVRVLEQIRQKKEGEA